MRAAPVPSDVPAALTELGLHLVRVTDTEAWSRCPGHERVTGRADRSPSWSCNLDSGLHSCFSCGWRGTFVHLVEYQLDLDWWTATAWVRRRSWGRLTQIAAPYSPALGANAAGVAATREPVAVSEDDLNAYGYPPRAPLRHRHLTVEACTALGILWRPPSTWILPIRDLHGKLIGWQTKDEISRQVRNHPPGVRKSAHLFGAHTLHLASAPPGPVVLVESPLDVARLRSAGWAGVAAYGALVSRRQILLLRTLGTRGILALDNDAAGLAATRRLIRQARRLIPLALADYSRAPGCKDIGDMTDAQIHDVLGSAYSPLWQPT